MLLATKVICLMLVFMFSPSMVFGAIRGRGFSAANAFLVAIGAVGFITAQWLV